MPEEHHAKVSVVPKGARPRSTCVNAAGLPMRTEITTTQTSDYLRFDLVMADKLARAIRSALRSGIRPRHYPQEYASARCGARHPGEEDRNALRGCDRKLYHRGNRVERRFNKLKNARRVATRYDKTAESFLGFIDITSICLHSRTMFSAAPKS